ncbi:hypothetical protein L1887_41892 [Cichorium endivia]|nr:hypothetical protein L1887_41892 [Cichorium endivia]
MFVNLESSSKSGLIFTSSSETSPHLLINCAFLNGYPRGRGEEQLSFELFEFSLELTVITWDLSIQRIQSIKTVVWVYQVFEFEPITGTTYRNQPSMEVRRGDGDAVAAGRGRWAIDDLREAPSMEVGSIQSVQVKV